MAAINYRQERIERLLEELRYEVTRGMMEGEIEEQLGFEFIVPTSRHMRHGVVLCSFRTAPSMPHFIGTDTYQPRLTVVKG